MLSGLLYFHRISDNRMAGTPLRNLNMFKDLCGRDNFKNVVLVTTMWDEVFEDVGLQREQELKEDLWKAMIRLGSTTRRFHLTEESAWEIINTIPKSPPGERLQIQREMVDENKPIHKTSAWSAAPQPITDIKRFFRRSSLKVKEEPQAKTRSTARHHLIPMSPSLSSISFVASYSSSSTINWFRSTARRDLIPRSPSSSSISSGTSHTSSSSTINGFRSTARRDLIPRSPSSSSISSGTFYSLSSTTNWSFWTTTTNASMSSEFLSGEDYRTALGSVITTLKLAQSVTELVCIHCLKEAIIPSLCTAQALEVPAPPEFIMHDAMNFYHRPWKEHKMHFSGSRKMHHY